MHYASSSYNITIVRRRVNNRNYHL